MFCKKVEDLAYHIQKLCHMYNMGKLLPQPHFLDCDHEGPYTPDESFSEMHREERCLEGLKRRRRSFRKKPEKTCLECGRRESPQWRR